jgi:uncharacterized membrane protein YdjX (TVP38/TMEM64 family)
MHRRSVYRNRGLLRAGLLVLLLVALAMALRFLPLQSSIDWLKERADALGAWAPVVFVLAFIGLTVVLLPGAPLNVAAGVIFGPIAGGIVTAVASNAAAAVSFFLGRHLARRTAARLVRRHPKLDAVYHTLDSRESWKLVAAVRLSHALPFGLQNFLLGASPVRFWTYLLTTFAVTLPGIFVVAYLGHLGAVALNPSEVAADSPWWWLTRFGGLAVAAIAIFYIGRTIHRAIKERAHIDVEDD